MKKISTRWLAPVVFSAMLAFPVLAGAEDQAAESAKSPSKETKMEDITVTARKQKENVQDVPMSISVITQMDIEDKKIEDMYDVADFAPSLIIPDNGASGTNSPYMRGIGADHGYNVPVGLYIDGVPKLSTFGYDEAFLDIERVEILKGPQGTLYGKNNEAGVINIITRQPDNESRSKISIEVGEDSKRQFTANLAGPIKKDKVYFGLCTRYYEKEGFITNSDTGDVVDDRKHLFGKAQLRFTPSDTLDISLIASRFEYDDGALRQDLTQAGAASYGLPFTGDRKVTSDLSGANESVSDTQSMRILWDINESLRLTSITARSVFDSKYTNDLDYSNLTLVHQLDDAVYSRFSQELRLDSTTGKLKWLVGLYWDSDKDETDYVTESIYPSYAGLTRRDIEGNSYSGFANASYPILKDLTLSAGIRYDKEEKEFKDYVNDISRDGEWDEISPKLSLSYNFNPNLMVYTSIAKGYRSGGFNPLTPTGSSYTTYDAESLWSYEIGEKLSLFDNRLVINGNLYYMDVSDMQVQEAISPRNTYLTNAAEATGKGVELEARARVMKGLDIMAGFAYNLLEFDTFEDANGNYEGNQNPYAPKFSYNVGFQYRNDRGYYVRADLIGYSRMYLDKANEYTRPAYQIVNAKVGYETANFDIYLYSRNLFDENYDSVGYFGGSYIIYSDPREVGLQMTFRY